MFGLLLAVSACGAPAPRPTARAAAATPASGVAAAAPTVTSTTGSGPTAATTTGPAAATPSAEGVLTATPSAGPVGTTVILQGRGCGNPASPTEAFLFFGNDGEPFLTGSVGAADIGLVAVDSAGQLRVTFRIPATFSPFQGRGGGPLRPGTYEFATEPPECLAEFVVVATTGKG
jgi:hypothetical protein